MVRILGGKVRCRVGLESGVGEVVDWWQSGWRKGLGDRS